MKLQSILERFLDSHALKSDGTGILIAFSGGPDSTALLAGLCGLTGPRRWRLFAAHLDHGLDPGSANRAQSAARICSKLGIPLTTRRVPPETWRRDGDGRPGESLEAAARRIRYAFLEETRQSVGADWIATAHHRDDQIETVMLRILYGSGIEGLTGITARRGRLIRPLLEAPQTLIAEAVAGSGLEPTDDPTNRNLSIPRNRLRLAVLPRLCAGDPALPESAIRLASAAAGASASIETRLMQELSPLVSGSLVTIDRRRLASLPDPIWPFALALLHRLGGAEYPPRSAARRELRRQISGGGRVGCDCGEGWYWSSQGDDLSLSLRRPPTPEFTYTLTVPGEVEIPEVGLLVRLSRGSIDAWMFRGSSSRAGLALPIESGDRVTIRNRRPGDRIRPLGCRNRRRLKDVLIDRRIPHWERDRLPLLCLDDQVAWVPGVTIDEAFRLDTQGQTWIAELSPL